MPTESEIGTIVIIMKNQIVRQNLTFKVVFSSTLLS